jgi:hypothetical protein
MGIYLNVYLARPGHHGNWPVIWNFCVLSTLFLNIALASMVAMKLLQARRRAVVMGTHMTGLASQYQTVINIVVESAIMWVLSMILYLASFNSHIRDLKLSNRISNFDTLLPFFTCLLEIISVSCQSLVGFRWSGPGLVPRPVFGPVRSWSSPRSQII